MNTLKMGGSKLGSRINDFVSKMKSRSPVKLYLAVVTSCIFIIGLSIYNIYIANSIFNLINTSTVSALLLSLILAIVNVLHSTLIVESCRLLVKDDVDTLNKLSIYFTLSIALVILYLGKFNKE